MDRALNQKIHLTAFWNHKVFEEEIRVFQNSLSELDYEVSYVPYEFSRDALNIVFGVIGMSADQIQAQASQVIIRNMEYVFPSAHFMFPRYIELLKRFPVWDYSSHNTDRLVEAGVAVVDYVPVCHSPVLECIVPAVQEDIDVYFYGNMTERRAKVLVAIRARGLNVVVSDLGNSQLFGAERDALIARAKIVLSIGQWDDPCRIFEVVRVGYLLANGKAVVGEVTPHTDIEDDIRSAVACGTLDEIPALCEALVKDECHRQALAVRGREIFRARSGKAIIGAAIERYLSHSIPVKSVCLPRQMRLESNLMGGWRYDFINVNSDPTTRADVHFRIDDNLLWNKKLPSWRFDELALSRGMVDLIIADHVFERLADVVKALGNCLELLSEGGVLELLVPYDLGFSAWAAPGSRRAFNERSFIFSKRLCVEFGWRDAFFENQGTVFYFAERGGELLDSHQDRQDLLATKTRSIESMRVRLVKKKMVWTDQDLLDHTSYYRE